MSVCVCVCVFSSSFFFFFFFFFTNILYKRNNDKQLKCAKAQSKRKKLNCHCALHNSNTQKETSKNSNVWTGEENESTQTSLACRQDSLSCRVYAGKGGACAVRRLGSLVVKESTLRVEDPGFDSCLCHESYQ